MKKLLFLFITFLTCIKICALPLGNPVDASLLCNNMVEDIFCCGLSTDDIFPCDWLSLRFGYYGDFVYNRHLEIDILGQGNMEHFELTTNAGYLAFNFCNRLDLFGTLGATKILAQANAATFGGAVDGGVVIFEMITDFSWSVGARGTILQYYCSALGAEFQYFYSENDVLRTTQLAQFSSYPADEKTKYHEWQIGVGLTVQIACLFPYIGVKWSHVHVDVPDEGGRNLQNAKCWGYAVGTTLVACNAASLTAEGRWGDEKALYINGQFRF